MNFRDYLNNIKEETTSADIATVDTKLDMSKQNKCKRHRKFNCKICKNLFISVV